MGLVVAVLLGALLVALAAGGRPARLADLTLRSRRLLVLALAAQAVGAAVGGPVWAGGLVASAALVVAFLARNRGVRGLGLVALGLLLNGVVVAANGAMPVSERAALRAGVPLEALPAAPGPGLAPYGVDDPRHEPETASTRLRLLGDVVPVPLPLRPEVVSPGDVLVAAGLGQLVLLGLLGRAGGGAHGAPEQAPALVPGAVSPRRPAGRRAPARSPRPRPRGGRRPGGSGP